MTNSDAFASDSALLGADLKILVRLVESNLFGDGDDAPSVGRYRLLRRLGSGGMGIVYSAIDTALERRVGLKLLYDSMEPQHQLRLRREATVLAKLAHPNVVQVFDVGEYEARAYIVMELVDGEDLRRWLTGATRSPEQVLAAFRQAGLGLGAAHEHGLVHRDFKPANVLLDGNGRVRVADFGLACDATSTVEREGRSAYTALHTGSSTSSGLPTHTGAMMGTPSYMAPEQWRADTVDARSDQFAFCVALYEALYAERPFVARDRDSLLPQIEAGPPTPPRRSGVPPHVVRALLRGLRPHPETRWPSMAALLRALERPLGRKVRGAVLAASVAIGVGALALPRDESVAGACGGGATALDSVWSEGRAQRIVEMLGRVDRPWAGTTAASVERALVGYVDDWNASLAAVCDDRDHARRTEAMVDGAMLCLQQQTQEFDARLSLLERADPELARRAVDLVSRLSSPSDCEQGPTVGAGLGASLSSEPAQTIRRELKDARALVEAGRYEECEPLLERLERAVGDSGDRYLLAELLAVRAELSDGLGERVAALETWKASYWLAEELEHRTAQAMVLERMPLAHLPPGSSPTTREHWLHVAESFVERHGALGRLPFVIGMGRAREAARSRDWQESDRRFRQFLELRQRQVGTRHVDVMLIDANFGNTMLSSGRVEEGLQMVRRASDTGESLFGEGHPRVLAIKQNLCAWLGITGRYRDALDPCQRVHRAAVETLGEDHPQTVRAATNLASVERELGMYERARERLETSLGQLAPSDSNTLIALIALAETHRGRGEPHDAIRIVEQAVAQLVMPTEGASGMAWVESHLAASEALMDQHRYDDAARRLEYAMRPTIGEAALPFLEVELGRVRLEQKRYDEARSLLLRHEELAQQAPTDAMSIRLLALVGLTRLAQETGQGPSEVLALASKADALVGPMQGVRAEELRAEIRRLRRLASSAPE